MELALIGATGFVGSAILIEALNRGHHVTVVLRHPEKLEIQNGMLTAVQGDVMDTSRLSELIMGNDVVISAYNAGWTNPDIYNEFMKGARSIQDAVKRSGVKRLVVMGGAGSLFITPGVQLIDSPNVPASAKNGALAARDYFNVVKEEKKLDWTFISPAIQMSKAFRE